MQLLQNILGIILVQLTPEGYPEIAERTKEGLEASYNENLVVFIKDQVDFIKEKSCMN